MTPRDEITRHPLPWKLGASGWLRLDGEQQEEIAEGRPVRLTAGNCIVQMSRSELAELYRKIGDVLMAPYRLIVAGGDTVPADKLGSIPAWLDDFRLQVRATGWSLQVVNAHANDAQALISAWCAARDVEVFAQPALDFSIGGNAVALLPTANLGDILTAARGEHDLPVHRVAPGELWGGRR